MTITSPTTELKCHSRVCYYLRMHWIAVVNGCFDRHRYLSCIRAEKLQLLETYRSELRDARPEDTAIMSNKSEVNRHIDSRVISLTRKECRRTGSFSALYSRFCVGGSKTKSVLYFP